MQPAILITSEHGGNQVPREYRALFRGAARVLQSHRGYDLGSLSLARRLGEAAGAPLIATEITRLLVEVNRSEHHPRLFSEFTASLDPAAKQELLEKYYYPHRRAVEQQIAQLAADRRTVLHIGVHSFTPVLNGQSRSADIGLLYDPARGREADFARCWREAWRRTAPALRIRRNYPYLGKSDGLVVTLRRNFSPERYIGIELEVNQALATSSGGARRALEQSMIESFLAACREYFC